MSSPTFTLVHEYVSGRYPVHHADLYRLGSLGEVSDLGLRERADLGAVVLVGIAALLLGGAREQMISQLIQDQIATFGNWGVAGALSIVLLAALIWGIRRWLRWRKLRMNK